MAKEKGTIVIKKIVVAGGGHHGGSWKVALADFMTAMMAFFLVMWLLGQSEETKKAVSDYFSTPSIIEYNFQNYGVEITLEKLFLDLLNEPMKAFQSFVEPSDKNPNLLDMGSAKVVVAYLADQMTDVAKNVAVTPDGFEFDIPDNILFKKGTADPLPSFVAVMDKIKGITTGLKDADINITSMLFQQAVLEGTPAAAERVATNRLDIIKNKILASLDNNSVQVAGTINVKEKKGEIDPNKLVGLIRISISQKPITASGRSSRKLETLFGSKVDMSTYDNYIKKMTGQKEDSLSKKKASNTKFGEVPSIANPVDEELIRKQELPPSEEPLQE